MLAITGIIIPLTIAITVVRHDIVMIMMHHIRVATIVIAVVMVIVVDDGGVVTALDRGDAIFVLAALVVRQGA